MYLSELAAGRDGAEFRESPRSPKTHTHRCTECGRAFYVCSERDCAMAPTVCQGCELDRMDAYLTSQELTRADHR